MDQKHYITIDEFQEKIFYENKRNLYLQYIEDGQAKLTTAKIALQELRNLVRVYNVKEVWAYNAGFDTSKIHSLAKKHDTGNPIAHLPHECIWVKAVQTIATKKSFQKWAYENQDKAFSEKGMIKTNAELIYSFITKNTEFEEEHTSLADCLIEYEILLKARKSTIPQFKGISHNVWLLAQTNKQIESLPQNFRSLIVEAREVENANKTVDYLNKNLIVKGK